MQAAFKQPEQWMAKSPGMHTGLLHESIDKSINMPYIVHGGYVYGRNNLYQFKETSQVLYGQGF
jgi:hypothetical protein